MPGIMEFFPGSLRSGRPQRSPKQLQLMPLLLVTHRNYMGSPCGSRHHILRLQHIEKLLSNVPGNFLSPDQLFHRTRRRCVRWWGRRWINDLIQRWTTLHATMATCHARCAHCLNSSMIVGGVTSHSLSRFEVWHYKQGQKSMARLEPTIFILLNAHAIKRPSKHLYLYSQTQAPLHFDQRNSFTVVSSQYKDS